MRRGELHFVITPESLAILVAALGAGRYIYVPQSTANADSFALLIGAEQTSRLVECFGGTQVYLPGLAQTGGFRNGPTLDQVAALTKAGESARSIALMFGCSTRGVAKKRRRLRGEEDADRPD